MKSQKLGDLVEITSGFAFKSEKFNSSGLGLPLIRIRDVLDGKSETYYDGDYNENYLINAGDALIGMDGQFNLACWKGEKALLNQRVCKISSNNKALDQRYLLNFLPLALKSIEDKTPFVTVKHLSVKDIKSIQIPLPSITEQRRIAAILDKAEALRSKRREAIAKLDQLLQSVFLEMFGDPASNPKNWPIGKISEMLSEVRYGSSVKADTSGEVPILRMNNLTYEGEMHLENLKYITKNDAIKNHLVEVGNILFNRTNSKELVGKTAVYAGPTPMAFAGYLVKGVVKSEHRAEYISAFMNSKYGKKLLQNTCKSIVGMANINAKEFGNIDIPIPPVELQEKFRCAVQIIRQKKKSLTQQAEHFQKLSNSLQQSFFTH